MMYVVSYDVTDDRRRQAVAETLLDFGHRVQYSVFECLLERDLLDKMLTRLREVIEPEQDRVRIYPLCADCRAGVQRIGRNGPELDPKVFII